MRPTKRTCSIPAHYVHNQSNRDQENLGKRTSPKASPHLRQVTFFCNPTDLRQFDVISDVEPVCLVDRNFFSRVQIGKQTTRLKQIRNISTLTYIRNISTLTYIHCLVYRLIITDLSFLYSYVRKQTDQTSEATEEFKVDATHIISRLTASLSNHKFIVAFHSVALHTNAQENLT